MERSNLDLIAGYLLQEKVVEFRNLLHHLKNTDIVSFLKDHKKILDKIIDVDTLIEEGTDHLDEILVLLAIAVDVQAVMIIDWSGEEYPGQVRKGIAQMLAGLNVHSFEWKNKNIEEQIIALEPRRGGYLPLLFRALDAELEQAGFNLGLIDIGQDCYYYFVLPKKGFDEIVNMEGEGFTILDTNVYEIYLKGAEAPSSKLMLYLKNKFNIPLGEVKTFLQQDKILIDTGTLSDIKNVKLELESMHVPYQIKKKE